MTQKHAVWTRGKVKVAYGRRRSSVNALVSDVAPGVALQEGEWIDFERDKNKNQIEPSIGWRAIAIGTGVAIGPVLYDRGRACAYAVDVSALYDWTADGPTPNAVVHRVYALWYRAQGKRLPVALRKALKEAEPTP